jgi:stalled ribosome alternative rescue factor ArfA
MNLSFFKENKKSILYGIAALAFVSLWMYVIQDQQYRFKRSKGRTGKGAKVRMKKRKDWRKRFSKPKTVIPNIL